MSINNEDTVEINVVGSTTGKVYDGKFKIKIWLSLEDELIRENKFRELIGPSNNNPSERALDLAGGLSELFVRVLEGPAWWFDPNAKLDTEPAQDLLKKTMEKVN